MRDPLCEVHIRCVLTKNKIRELAMIAVLLHILLLMVHQNNGAMVSHYHDIDHDDDGDSIDAEESGGPKEGGNSANPVPIDWQSHLIH